STNARVGVVEVTRIGAHWRRGNIQNEGRWNRENGDPNGGAAQTSCHGSGNELIKPITPLRQLALIKNSPYIHWQHAPSKAAVGERNRQIERRRVLPCKPWVNDQLRDHGRSSIEEHSIRRLGDRDT